MRAEGVNRNLQVDPWVGFGFVHPLVLVRQDHLPFLSVAERSDKDENKAE